MKNKNIRYELVDQATDFFIGKIFGRRIYGKINIYKKIMKEKHAWKIISSLILPIRQREVLGIY